MNIFKLLFELFVIYLLYKFIFEFIIPIYRTTKQVQRKMSDMHQRMQQQEEKPPVNNQYTNSQSSAPKRQAHEDYIDYEEVK